MYLEAITSRELVGHVPMKLSYLIYTFLRAYDDNEVSVKVTGSRRLENRLVVPGTFKARTPSRAIATKFEREILWLKVLSTHMDSWNFEKNSNVVIKCSDNKTRHCRPLKKYRNNQYPYSFCALYYFFFFWGSGHWFEVGRLKSTFWGWALIGGWVLINFFHLLGGRLFQVGSLSE